MALHYFVFVLPILRRYLLELNRASETLYIIEPVLSDIKRPFTLQLVLPGWTARFHAPPIPRIGP